PGLREVTPRDTTRAREDANQPLTNRPRLSDQLVLRVVQPWRPDARYELELKGVRSVSGVVGDAKGVLAIPKRAPIDTLKAATDSIAPARDSLKRMKKRP
ncbi:MAG: hypothetical protein ABI766_08405, partial [Gemmatimonadales bacterium]